MKKIFIIPAIILALFACKKPNIEEPDPVWPPPPPPPPIDTFALTGKVLVNWEYAHVYGIKYKVLPFGESGLLPGVDDPAKWSHGGDKIAVSDSWSLLILDAETLDTLYCNNWLSGLGGFAWSPDDSAIAFTVIGTNKIRLFNLQTSTWKNLSVPNNYKVFGMLDWSGANNLLVFTAQTTDTVSPYGLFTIHPDGTNTTLLSSFPASFNLGNPRFSPTGTTIAFDGSDLDTHSVFLIETTGQSLRKYWKGAFTPCWSADGTCLMANVTYPNAGQYGEDVVQIEVKNIDGNHGIRTVNIPGANYPTLIDWRP